MRSNQNPAGAVWRKSSYSGNTGGDCVECAPLGGAAWRKASYSSTNGGECVEVAAQACRVAVRDSKNPDGPAFAVGAAAFAAFVRSL
ncbi:toxin [Streptomyces sp. WM6373]|uniref:DUF397 domain-containing protein n=1 Tax=Streptomyces TaxID=1883 RepID=UPI0006ADC37A|nr:MULTISPECIES: DUF397 domain-containing protein [unclassified Streptomyces]KOU29522.1 toxin [Streptomyces sp. WM6373]KOU71873.1 toxin [Streptomyces sp. XY66]KOV24492.1 toxin [Streptomyces sp. XY413]